MKRDHTRGDESNAGEREPGMLSLPPRYDEGPSSEYSGEHTIWIEPEVEEWERIPTNGPRVPVLGTYLVLTAMVLLVVWTIIGFVWLFCTGQVDVLTLSPTMVGALGATVAYKQLE